MNLNKRDQKEILEYLELIYSELTDVYNLTDTAGNTDANCYTSTAIELVDELRNNIEDNQKEPVPHEDIDREGGLMGPDRLPLNFPYDNGDGEGRLKGRN